MNPIKSTFFVAIVLMLSIPATFAYIGDGVCEPGENIWNAPEDCDPNPQGCVNGACVSPPPPIPPPVICPTAYCEGSNLVVPYSLNGACHKSYIYCSDGCEGNQCVVPPPPPPPPVCEESTCDARDKIVCDGNKRVQYDYSCGGSYCTLNKKVLETCDFQCVQWNPKMAKCMPPPEPKCPSVIGKEGLDNPVKINSPTGYVIPPGEYLNGESITVCTTLRNVNSEKEVYVSPSLKLFHVLETDCGKDVTDNEPDYSEQQLNSFHTQGCGDSQSSLGVQSSHPSVQLGKDVTQQFCFTFTPPAPGYYRCEIDANSNGAIYHYDKQVSDTCEERPAWCYVRVSTKEVPEFGALAAGLAIAGAGAGLLLLRKKQ